MGVMRYLVDKSALARLHLGPVQDVLVPLMDRGLVAICGPTELEVLFSVRNLDDRHRLQARLRAVLGWVDTPEDVWTRASALQESLTAKGQHRSAGIADLTIAVTAAAHRLSVLHYDHDFDTIAEHTGQPTEWVVPPGTV